LNDVNNNGRYKGWSAFTYLQYPGIQNGKCIFRKGNTIFTKIKHCWYYRLYSFYF